MRKDAFYSRIFGYGAAAGMPWHADESKDSVQAKRSLAFISRLTKVPFRGTEEAVRDQLAAMACDVYEVGILPPEGSDLTPLAYKRWTAEQVLEPKNLAFLQAMNCEGYEIYVRPDTSRDRSHGIILIDDVTSEGLKELESSGYQPSAIVNTSPGSYHAWVRVNRKGLSPEEGNELARALARRWGDPGSGNWGHFGRLAGFTNKKKIRIDPKTGLSPFVKLVQAADRVCDQGRAVIAEVRRFIAERRQEEENRRREREEHARRFYDEYQPGESAEADFLRYRAAVRVLRKEDGRLDESAGDYGAAVEMMKRGWSRDQVEDCLYRLSPDLQERHPSTADYVERTVEAAALAADVQVRKMK